MLIGGDDELGTIAGQLRTTLVAIPDRAAQRLAALTALIPFAFLAAAVTVLMSMATMLLTTGTPEERVDLAMTLRITPTRPVTSLA